MIELTFTGHLGTDVQIVNNTCRLRVAVNSMRVVEGERVEETQWITVFASNERLKGLVPFLKKGTKVFVSGRPSFGVYSSPIERRFVPDVTCWLNVIEVLAWPNNTDAPANSQPATTQEDKPF